ncbi:MAG: peptidyl-prolyl cis-trans isomerase [Bacteroidia bacterium]
MKHLLTYFLFIPLLFACNKKTTTDETRKLIARADLSYLYEDDISDLIPEGLDLKDSIELVKKYVDNWVRESLLIQQAENNLTDEKKNVDAQLKDYRNSLIKYAYEKELVNQKLDTVISNKEIEEYYNNNQVNFELKDNIIQVVYVKVNKKAPKLDLLKTWYASNTPADKEQLAGYCHQFAENFYLDDSTWLYFDDLLKEIPLQAYNKELFLQNNRLVEVSDSVYDYFLNIKGFKIKNSISPLSLERDNIRNIILNKRKLQLITKMKQDIYAEAFNNHKIEIYINDKIKK